MNPGYPRRQSNCYVTPMLERIKHFELSLVEIAALAGAAGLLAAVLLPLSVG